MSSTPAVHYYDHSNSYLPIERRSPRATPWFALCLLLAACGASNTQLAQGARRLPIAHISELPEAERPNALTSLPLVLEIPDAWRTPASAHSAPHCSQVEWPNFT